ncbi:hypothetical protein [Streptomyces sp. NBC_00239]|uniref:hypothetical protein n=1 Tax=Streptomyces sp. NBC_00239 TaxID=2903640 RepID=UPI002E298EF3|nr:hypothetical protein [Streptomyces sp. NBC_00239]
MRRHAPEGLPAAAVGRTSRRRTARAARTRRAWAAAALLAVTAVTGCGEEPDPEPQRAAAVTQFNENGVTVRLTVSDWESSAGTVVATFTPDEAGFHLYPTDLPAQGVEGVGRPTRVRPADSVAAAGKLTVDAPVKTIKVPGVNGAVPVYPDGPVTATLPVRATASGRAELLVSYASCSATEGCTIPVADRVVTVHTTADHLSFTTG